MTLRELIKLEVKYKNLSIKADERQSLLRKTKGEWCVKDNKELDKIIDLKSKASAIKKTLEKHLIDIDFNCF
jgi:hypothetical protein